MGNAQSRREAREAQRKKNNRKWAALGGAAIILLSGGVITYNLSNQNKDTEAATNAIPTSCASTQRVTVDTTAAMAEVIKQVPVDAQDCIVLSVNNQDTNADIANQIISGKSAPNLWIPDSSTRAELALEGKAKIVTKSDSLANSPAVIVTKDTYKKYDNWNQALADIDKVTIGEPSADSGAFLALLNSADEVTAGTTHKDELSTSIGARAQTIGVENAAETSTQLLDGVASGTHQSVIVTEADYAQYQKEHSASDLKAYVPETGTDAANYPMYQPTSGAQTNSTVDKAAEKINDFIASDEGKKALGEAGLRVNASSALSENSVGTYNALTSNNANTTIAEVWTAYSLQSAPLNALLAIDVSGSMANKIGDTGQTRMTITTDSILAGYHLFPARDSMGLWSFSTDMSKDANGKSLDYKELVPIRNLSEETDGKSQRDLLLDAGSSLKPLPDNATGLYDTILTSYKDVRDNYKNGALNTVIVMTDGENHDTNSNMSEEELIQKIDQLRDPDHPIYPIFIGISDDADMATLQDIASKTGGQAFPANSAEDIGNIFAQALSVSSIDGTNAS